MNKKKVVILGGGLAGLAAGWKLSEEGIPVEIIEKNSYLGGLAATLKLKKYYFDFGGHRFITKQKDTLREIQKLVGQDFQPRMRQTQYLLWNKYLNYPLELGDLLRKVSLPVAISCLVDYFVTRTKNLIVPMKEDNFEDWVTKRFGRRLYQIFFGQYTAKIWGIPPRKISRDWASQRISIINLGDALRQLFFRPKVDPRTYTRKYYYPDYGIGQIAQKMAAKIKNNNGKIYLNASVEQIKLKHQKIEQIFFNQDGQIRTILTDQVLNTIPITELIQKIKPTPPLKIIRASQKLRYRAIIFVLMIVAQSKISDNDAIYVPESQYIFFRIEQYKFWSAKMVPDPKKTSLCLEITCFKDDQLWKMADEKILARSIDDLVKAGLIKNKRVVEDYWIVRQNHVYPVFEIGYQERIKPIKNWVDQIPNLISYGRQGSYKYIHMHHVITQGFRAAEYLQGKIKKEGIFEIGTQGEYFG